MTAPDIVSRIRAWATRSPRNPADEITDAAALLYDASETIKALREIWVFVATVQDSDQTGTSRQEIIGALPADTPEEQIFAAVFSAGGKYAKHRASIRRVKVKIGEML